ncbi:hypothetical protein [Maricaulis parjimensis]|uniref:hypothetical protein n=1 Tax=Maricaulis parjimensis TaxID=144023 RepID=UPI00193A8D54|nr:hypothetical protein [Maricaulis parjimensis]
MALDNLQKSELVISKILEALVEQGIQCRTHLPFAELGLSDELKPFFEGCCLWLYDEGIVRCTNPHQLGTNGSMVNPSITAYGFQLLGQKFLAGDKEEALGTAVKEVASGQKNYAAIGDFFGGILGGFTKSLGSG